MRCATVVFRASCSRGLRRADANRDSQISNEELYSYLREQVMRFSAGSQTPEIMAKNPAGDQLAPID